jgi:type IV pilus assembly protein PilB
MIAVCSRQLTRWPPWKRSVEPPQSSLSGVARVLVHAGKLSSKTAEDLAKSAKERRKTASSAV